MTAVHEVVVCITPFDSSGRFDLDLTRTHLSRVMDHARTVLVGGSGTEEGFTLSTAERETLLTTAVEMGRERGVGVRLNAQEPRHTGLMLADIELARSAGAEAIHVPILDIGHGYKPNDAELMRYADSALADTGGLPVYISSSQAMGQVFPISVLEHIAEFPHVRGMVVGAPSDGYLAEVLERFATRWRVHMAGTGHLLNGLALGATGFVSPEGNVAPEASRAVADAVTADDWAAAVAAAAVLLRITAVVMPLGGLATGLKTVLRGLGVLDSSVRSPRIDPDAERTAAAGAAVREALERWNATR